MLLVAEGRGVSLHRLVEAVWDADPPPTAAKAVRNSVSALRGRLAEVGASGSLISTEVNGYRLDVDGCYLDLRDFRARIADARQAAATGQAHQAAAEMRAGLALWHGQALTGLGGGVIEAVAANLDEQRLAALEECIDLELALGTHRQLIGELQAVAGEHPLRERLAAQLMIALYRSGRQADALAVYRQLAARLTDELGIQPAVEVARLHEAILRQAPSLDPRERIGARGLEPAPPRPAREGAVPERTAVPSATGDRDAAAAGDMAPESNLAYQPDTPGRGPRYPLPGGRRPSWMRYAALGGACTLGAATMAGVAVFWPPAAPPGKAARVTPAVSAARDNTDPYADGCIADRKAIATEPVYWPGGRLFGHLVLYYSASCQAAWGYLDAPNSATWTIHIVPHRPSDRVSVPWQFSGNVAPGSWSNALSVRPGCVYVEAFVSSKAGAGPRASTPCFTGTGPEVRQDGSRA